MTTLTTAFALIPMSLGLGAGAELQAPMARTVVGGLTVASLFILFFIPTPYSLLESAKSRLWKQGAEELKWRLETLRKRGAESLQTLI